MRILKKLLLAAAILIAAVACLAAYLVRGGFQQFATTPYPLPPPAWTASAAAHRRAYDAAVAHPKRR